MGSESAVMAGSSASNSRLSAGNGSELPFQDWESAGNGRESAGNGRESASMGRESTSMGRESAGNGRESASNGRESAGNGRLSAGNSSELPFQDWESAAHIDSRILRLLQKKYESPAAPQEKAPVKPRRLCLLYATFLGIGAMVMVLLIGILRGTDADFILAGSGRALLVFCGIGFIAGMIAEMCIRESAKSMIREMLQRCDDSRVGPANDMSKDAP